MCDAGRGAAATTAASGPVAATRAGDGDCGAEHAAAAATTTGAKRFNTNESVGSRAHLARARRRAVDQNQVHGLYQTFTGAGGGGGGATGSGAAGGAAAADATGGGGGAGAGAGFKTTSAFFSGTTPAGLPGGQPCAFGSSARTPT